MDTQMTRKLNRMGINSMLNVMDYVNDYYKSLGVTNELASACLWARLKNLSTRFSCDCEGNDGYEKGYHMDTEGLHKFCPVGVHPQTLGDSIYDEYIEELQEFLLATAPKNRNRKGMGKIWQASSLTH